VKKCPRCAHWHHAVASDVCDHCWEEMGQMQFEDFGLIRAEDYEPPIDTVFDREEEARGYQ
jgi:hypothetical protein